MRPVLVLAFLAALGPAALAASKPHVISFGKVTNVPWFVGASEDTKLTLKVRALYVDAKLKEFTTGAPRDITDHTFVVRQAYRINDQLPQEPKTSPKWKWQRGVWLLVDRRTGRVTALNLPDFDPFYSAAAWYRDYVAYCGVGDDGERLYAVIAQIGRKKPLVRSALGPAHGGNLPDSECDPPTWQRPPARVTFSPKAGQAVTFAVHGQSADVASPSGGSEE